MNGDPSSLRDTQALVEALADLRRVRDAHARLQREHEALLSRIRPSDRPGEVDAAGGVTEPNVGAVLKARARLAESPTLPFLDDLLRRTLDEAEHLTGSRI